MQLTFPVIVMDDAHKPVSGARVCLVARSTLGAEHHPYPSLAATHSDAGGGKYDDGKKITLTEGDWVLVATLKGKAPVVQQLKVKKASDGSFTVTPSPWAVATVIIPNAGRAVGGEKRKEVVFEVTFYPAAELVFIAGVDYHKADVSRGWQFHAYGFNRAEILRREKKIHLGTIVTVFSTSQIWRTTRVWGGKRWVDVEVAQLGDPTKRKLPLAGMIYEPEKGLDINITDFYKYLAAVGAREPKSVKEVGIFGHSWPGGPILYNTWQATSSPRREDGDFDPRAKDFNNTNFPAYEKMSDALAPGCRFTIWGCSATTHFKARSRQALDEINAGRAEDHFFTVKTESKTRDSITIENTSELRHRFDMDMRFRGAGGTYAGAAARKLKIEVRAACPGTGSDKDIVDGVEMLMVPLETYSKVLAYFHKKFAPEFAETRGKWDRGFVDYHALQSRVPVPRPAFSTKYFYIEIKLNVVAPAQPYAEITFWNGIAHKIRTPEAKHLRVVTEEAKDLVTPGVTGELVVLEEPNPDKSHAVYVQPDERVFQMWRPDRFHKWEPLTELLPRP